MPNLVNSKELTKQGYEEVLFTLPSLYAEWPLGSGTALSGGIAQASRRLSEASVAAVDLPLNRIQNWQESSTSIVRALEFDLAQLEQLYVFRSAEVSRFLRSHSALVPLLEEAASSIRRHFGPDVEIVLEVVTDPEITDYRELVAFIRTSLEANEALDRLNKLDEDWWLDALPRAEGNLCIDLDFV